MKFTWHKKKLIISPAGTGLIWAKKAILTPTPIVLGDVIRIYAGFCDADQVSRIGYVDVARHNPKEIVKISERPCLDIGSDGSFDDNGVILGDIITNGHGFRMYYVGFQLVKKAKFLAFSGLASSEDGEVFNREQAFPVLDRDFNASTINAIHTVLYIKEEECYRIWHAKGDDWQIINGKYFPKYNIWSSTSKDGVYINKDAELCVDVENDEYRIGRPSVYKIKNHYVMFYTKGTTSGKDYYPGIAISRDGKIWQRNDALFGLALSQDGWDSLHLSYPRLVAVDENKFYVFYNGNNMGETGIGYAELFIED